MRTWRPVYKDLTRLEKKKSNARAYANVYQRRGKLRKPSRCQDCKRRRKLEKHHEDYDKPLQVEWLCNECHKKR